MISFTITAIGLVGIPGLSEIHPVIISYFRTLSAEATELFDFPIRGQFPPMIDLSIHNVRNTGPGPSDRDVLTRFVEARRSSAQSRMVWGGYLEQRLIYANSEIFHQASHPRSIHLGLDFWMPAGERVYSPLPGTIHSLHDNDAFGDYGPTIIVRHEIRGQAFHLLYGHLSRASLLSWVPGQVVPQGHLIGSLGNPAENGNWPPHLHFQIVLNMEGMQGDYPGVCSVEELAHYAGNCPDPRFLLGL